MNIELIKELFEKDGLELMINPDEPETENFFRPLCKDNSSHDSNDTRYILNKKKVDMRKFVTELGIKLEYIKSGTTGHTFKGEIVKDDKVLYTFALKAAPYSKHKQYGQVTNITRPENAEIKMLRTLSYFIINKQTPHLIIPIQTFDTDTKFFVLLEKLGTIKKDLARYKEFVAEFEKGDKSRLSETASILISEWANRGDFMEFIRQRYKGKGFTTKIWKAFFFQILSVLAVIQNRYPAFRHNDLKANNILVNKLPDSSRKRWCHYQICGKHYFIPETGYQMKLWDFDFACIPGIVDNIKVTEKWTNEKNINMKQNRYYDIHYFFNSLLKYAPAIWKDTEHIEPEVTQFINRVVPIKYREGSRVNDSGRLMTNDEYTTPIILLENDEFFEEYRHAPEKLIKKFNKH